MAPSSASRCFMEVEREERATYISLAAMFMLPLSTILINCSNCSIFTDFPDSLYKMQITLIIITESHLKCGTLTDF